MVQVHRHHSTATLTIDATERPALVSDATSERALLVVTTNGACHAFEFGARTSLTIGRAEPADILLADPSLSRVHACFRREDRAVRVVDLGSRNGTWVAGERIDEALLSVGSSAVLGQSRISM